MLHAIFHILFLLYAISFLLPNDPLVFEGIISMSHSELSNYSHCFNELWVSGYIVLHWKNKNKKLLCPRLRAAISSCAQWIQCPCFRGESAVEIPLHLAFGMLIVVSTTCGWMLKGICTMETLRVYGRTTGLQIFFPQAPYRSVFSRSQEWTTKDSKCDQNTESHCCLSLGAINGKRQKFNLLKPRFIQRARNLRRQWTNS